MKKNINIFLILNLAILLFSCKHNLQEKINGWDYKEVNGKVKSYTIRQFDAEKDANGNWKKKDPEIIKHLIWESEFNQEGRLINEKIYDSYNEKLVAKWDYQFENNILKKIRIFDFEKNSSKDILITKVYPEFKILEMNDNGEISYYEWSGNRISKSSGDNKDYNGASKYIYDKNGNLIKGVTSLDYKNKPDEIYNFNYQILNFDEANNWTKLIDVNNYNNSIGTIKERTIIYY